MRLVFATNNMNKFQELEDLLPENIELLSLHDIGCHSELPETKETLEGNAMQKAEFVFASYGYNCFSDDTGLEVKALNNAPGVYSARYAGNDCVASNNIRKLLDNLKSINNRSASFRTVIALLIDGKKCLFEGKCSGNITKEILGNSGFGYDPIFLPDGSKITFAQMTQKQKGMISHRAKATDKLVNFLQNY
tara:strand:- start:6118 stop:6693 length:576 start_codon:yes stop_codon:yes gene_type:complete